MVKFLKKVLFQNRNFQMNLHQLVKKYCQKSHDKRSKQDHKNIYFAALEKNPDSYFCMAIFHTVHTVCRDFALLSIFLQMYGYNMPQMSYHLFRYLTPW